VRPARRNPNIATLGLRRLVETGSPMPRLQDFESSIFDGHYIEDAVDRKEIEAQVEAASC
jgi:hypothetical protein